MLFHRLLRSFAIAFFDPLDNIPAALAVAEREHADGQAFLLAVVLGYDAALRVGEAVNPSHYRIKPNSAWPIASR